MSKPEEHGFIFSESGLRFTFSREFWQVRRYDSHTYFRGLSGAGLKGVDFIGIYKNQELVLIEVKNYQTGVDGRRSAFIHARLSDPQALAAALVAKMRDTLRAIGIIQQYLQRKWAYRLARPLMAWFPGLAPEWHFWMLAHDLAGVQVRLLCILEVDDIHRPLLGEIERYAALLIAEGERAIRVVSGGENPFAPTLEIDLA